MSVHRRATKSYQVRWEDGDRQRAKTFSSKRDAQAFQDKIRRLRQIGGLDLLDAGTETLAEFVETWWRLHAVPNLSPNTRANYARVWDKHVLPRLGTYRLRELTPSVVQDFRVTLGLRGANDPTVLKALTVLQSVLRLAVLQGRIQSNPVAPVRKPSQVRKHRVRPLSPDVVEEIRAQLRARDAALVSLLAYGGLRPGEARGLTWGHVRERTILIEGRTKTGRHRTVELLAPLAQDLAEWQLASGRPGTAEPIFATRKGGHWNEYHWRNWRRRIYRPAAEAVGAPNRPYDLRHSFVSLMIHQGNSIVDVASQAGHSVQTCSSTYAHVFAEFNPSERVPAEQVIREARAQRPLPGVRQLLAAGA
jgi:integrase